MYPAPDLIPIVAAAVRDLRPLISASGLDIDDVCQDAAAAVLAALPDWRPASCALSTYMTRRARWAALDYINRERNAGTASKHVKVDIVPIDDAENLLEPVDPDLDPGTSVHRAVAGLPADLRGLIVRRYGLDGQAPQSIPELARTAKVSERTIKRALRRALRELAGFIGH